MITSSTTEANWTRLLLFLFFLGDFFVPLVLLPLLVVLGVPSLLFVSFFFSSASSTTIA